MQRASAAHVEYMALSDCYKNVYHLRQLLSELGIEEVIKEPTVLFGDNVCANELTARSGCSHLKGAAAARVAAA